MERARDQREKEKAWSGGLVIYLSFADLPFGVPAQSRHLLLPWHRPHLSLAFEPPHAPPQSVLQSLEESELQMPHLQQEKKSRGADS